MNLSNSINIILILIAGLSGSILVAQYYSPDIYYSEIDPNQYIKLFHDNTFEYQGVGESFGGTYIDRNNEIILIAHTLGIEYRFEKQNGDTIIDTKKRTVWKK